MIEHLRGRDRKLEPLGWTGPDAEWIALVCLHSGVFTRAQFCDYFDARIGSGRLRFVQSIDGPPKASGRGRMAASQWGGENLPDIEQHRSTGR